MKESRCLKYNTNFNEQGVEAIRDNEIYSVRDNTFLTNLVVSETILKPNKQTNGHKHDSLDEVYMFISGRGKMNIDEKTIDVEAGDIINVKGGEFHQVVNESDEEIKFIAIFQKYER